MLKRRLEKLEEVTASTIELATIPAGATLEEATRIFENNLRLDRLHPRQKLNEASAQPMTLEEATAVYEREIRANPVNTPKANSDA